MQAKRDRFGLRTRERLPPTLHGDIAARLRALAADRESPAAWAEVEAAMDLPWWGVRLLAIRAVGHWRSGRGKAWLVQRANRRLPSSGRSCERRHRTQRWCYLETVEARTAVAAVLDAGDAAWVLDLAFAGYAESYGLHDCLRQVPDAAVLARITHELAHGGAAGREGALWLASGRPWLPGRLAVVQRLADGDDAVASQARRLLRMEAQRAAQAPPPARAPR